MRKSYFTKDGIWLKGNLHCHTTVSDGVLTPSEIAEAYCKRGYDFLAITDHNLYVKHSDLPVAPLLLMGVEHDLAYSKNKCTHIVGTGIAEREKTLYDCRKYMPGELTDQGLIDMMQGDGQFVILAHPIWSRMEPEEVRVLTGFHAIEVYNNGCENLCHAGHGEVYWDMLLRSGKKVYGVATDDTHKPWDMFGGWICVKAKEKSYNAIMDALFAGQFYASSGPEIEDFGVDGNEVYVFCSPCKEIHFVTYPPRGKSYFAEKNESLERLCYTRKGGEKYVRVECIDNNGRVAWTNPIFFESE